MTKHFLLAMLEMRSESNAGGLHRYERTRPTFEPCRADVAGHWGLRGRNAVPRGRPSFAFPGGSDRFNADF